MNRFQKVDNTAPVQSRLKADTPDVQRSLFDLTRIKNTTVNIGELTVIDCIETLPGDIFKNINYIIKLQSRNPTVKSQLTGMRAYVHVYYNRMSDLWEGAQNFIDSGTSGKVQLTIPTLRTTYKTVTTQPESFTICTPMSLTNMLDVPPTMFHKGRDRINAGWGSFIRDSGNTYLKMSKEYGNTEINALPYVMYQKIYIEKYANRNLIQENKNFIPDNQKHFILPYDASVVSTLSYDNPDELEVMQSKYITSTSTDSYINPNSTLIVPESTSPNDPVWLGAIRYRQKKGDYFNTALPFSQLVRGDIPNIALDLDNASLDTSAVYKQFDNIPGIDIYEESDAPGTQTYRMQKMTGSVYAPNLQSFQGNTNLNTANNTNKVYRLKVNEDNLLDVYKILAQQTKVNASLKATIDLATLNALEAFTIFRQRMALTNGRYNEQVKAQFGYSPKAPTTDAQYIGGFYLDINQEEVLQTSETATTPLGTKAGRLQAMGSSGKLKFRAPDYGYIMAILSIMPDNYQDKGLERWTTRKDQSETYFPIFNNLAPQAILNKELFWSGDENIDNDIYAWTERYADYKERKNKVTGLLQVKEIDDSRYIAMDTYESLPTLSNSFVTLSRQNVDMGIFTTDNEPPFIASIGEIVKVVRSMPYVTMPAGLKSNNL